MSIILNILNESVATTTDVLPQMDIFGAGIVVLVGIVVLIVVIRHFLKIKKE